MKSKKITIVLIVLLSIICVSIITFMINLLNGNIKISNFHIGYKVSNELILDELYEIDFKKIDIITNASDIYIRNANDDKIRVVIYGDKDNTKVTTNNNELEIVTKEKKCIGFCFNKTISKVEVYLPRNYKDTIKIVNNYGDVEIEEFVNATVNIDEDYGDIEVKKANSVNIKQSAGDVKVGTVNDVTIENNYGDIHVENINNYLSLSNDCGDIKVDNLSIIKDSYIKDDFGDIKIGSTNEIYIDAKTDLGDVKINNNYHKAEITLNIENDCGDIIVKN